jgi:hypothetical protein
MSFLAACKDGLPVDKDPELAILCAGNDEKLALQARVAKETILFIRAKL